MGLYAMGPNHRPIAVVDNLFNFLKGTSSLGKIHNKNKVPLSLLVSRLSGDNILNINILIKQITLRCYHCIKIDKC